MTEGAPRERPRLGLVSFLNARPIGYGLLHGRLRGRFEVREAPPASLADLLACGALDFALLPSIEYARARLAGREDAIVPGIAIASSGAAASVLLFSRAAPDAIRTVALDASSRTSVVLLRLLFRRRIAPGRPEPTYASDEPDLPAMLRGRDAALLIGDRALFASREHPSLVRDLRTLDLGFEWTAWTGLPFVYAFWAGSPRGDAAAIGAALNDSLEEGLGRLEEIAAEQGEGDPERTETIHRYLSRTLGYRLGPDEQAGLTTFYRLACEEGLLAAPPPPLVFHPADGRSARVIHERP